MTRDNYYFPHMYMTIVSEVDEKFDVYICVPHKAGERVVFISTIYKNGVTEIYLKVVSDKDTVNMQEGKFYLREELEHKSKLYNFDINEFTVSVSVESESGNFPTKINNFSYELLDNSLSGTGPIAFNCPYIFLRNPNKYIDVDPIKKFLPYCIVPLSKLVAATPQPSANINPSNGICLQNVELQDSNGSLPDLSTITGNSIDSSLISNYSEVPFTSIDSNQKEYTDTNPIEGYFQVEVYNTNDPAPGKRRKGKARNVSSEPNPTPFIDFPL